MKYNKTIALYTFAVSLIIFAATSGIFQERLNDPPSEDESEGDNHIDPPFVARRELLESLRSENGPHFEVLEEDGQVVYIGGRNLAPNCDNVTNIEEVEMGLQCFFQSTKAAYAMPSGENAADIDWRVSSKRVRANDTMIVARIKQYVEDIPVKGSEAVITFSNGRAVQFSGKLICPKELPHSHSLNDKQIPDQHHRRALRDKVGKQLNVSLHDKAVRRYYDPNEGTVVVEYEKLGYPGERVRVSEKDSSLLETIDTTLYGSAYASTKVGKYQNTFDWTKGGKVSQWASVGFLEERFQTIRGYCDAKLNWWASKHGYPKIVYHRDGGDVDFVTGFTPSTYVKKTAHQCGKLKQLMVGTGPGDLDWDLMNIYFWIHDLADFAHHWRAAYRDWFVWTEGENLKVVLSDKGKNSVCKGRPGCARPGITEYQLWINRKEESGKTSANLALLAHEYGHIMHFMYGGDYDTGDLFFGDHDVLGKYEGFANHNILRYAMFRYRENSNRPFDPFTGLSWEDANDAFSSSNDYKVKESIENGLKVPVPFNQRASNIDTVRASLIYNPKSSVCKGSGWSSEPYACGSVLVRVYWELAWNRCRVSYASCSRNQRILTTSSYAPEAERLANVAYTAAIINIHDDARISAFFGSISQSYNNFLKDGWISNDEYSRVHAVMQKYCVGWSNHCNDWHKLPGSSLPIWHSHRASFGNGDNEELVFAKEMQYNANAKLKSHGKESVAKYLDFRGGSEATKSIYIRTSAYYSFRGVFSAALSCCDSVWLSIGGGKQHYWGLSGADNWKWKWFDGPRFYLTGGKYHVVKISHRENVKIDAILMKKS